MFTLLWVQKFLKDYLRGKYTQLEVCKELNKQTVPLENHINRLEQKIREQKKVIEHLKRKIESYE